MEEGDCVKKLRSLLFTVLNWRFSDATREMGEEVRHIEVILRGFADDGDRGVVV
jgi:hypothetical protein